MPHRRGVRIPARTPWDSTEQALQETDRDVQAPVQEVTYRCDGNRRRAVHDFTVTYAEGAEYRDAVDCRCGGTGRLPGAPEDATAVTPKYGPVEYRAKGRMAEDVTPWAQLMKRRTMDDLEALLAERMSEVRQQGFAR